MLRIYEAIGKPAPGVKIKFQAKITSAERIVRIVDDAPVSVDLSCHIPEVFALSVPSCQAAD